MPRQGYHHHFPNLTNAISCVTASKKASESSNGGTHSDGGGGECGYANIVNSKGIGD